MDKINIELIGESKYKLLCEWYYKLDDNRVFKYKLSDIIEALVCDESIEIEELPIKVQLNCIAYCEYDVCDSCRTPLSFIGYRQEFFYKPTINTDKYTCKKCSLQEQQKQYEIPQIQHLNQSEIAFLLDFIKFKDIEKVSKTHGLNISKRAELFKKFLKLKLVQPYNYAEQAQLSANVIDKGESYIRLQREIADLPFPSPEYHKREEKIKQLESTLKSVQEGIKIRKEADESDERERQENLFVPLLPSFAEKIEEEQHTKEELMVQAYQQQVFYTLPKKEQDFLLKLPFTESNVYEAIAEAGINSGDLPALMKKLYELHIIYTNDLENIKFLFEFRLQLFDIRIKNRREKAKEAKKIAMLEAFENSIYESLNGIEYNFFVNLLALENFSKAQRKVGINQDNALKILLYLDEINLIDLIDEDKKEFRYFEGFRYFLKDHKPKTKSIFGSVKESEMFRMLKRRFLFVYPQVPLCSFIETDAIQHLLDKNSNKFSYFLSCRLDCLVCDKEGNPKIAFEYQGGYHLDADQKWKDELKRSILEFAGIPLHDINSYIISDESSFELGDINLTFTHIQQRYEAPF